MGGCVGLGGPGGRWGVRPWSTPATRSALSCRLVVVWLSLFGPRDSHAGSGDRAAGVAFHAPRDRRPRRSRAFDAPNALTGLDAPGASTLRTTFTRCALHGPRRSERPYRGARSTPFDAPNDLHDDPFPPQLSDLSRLLPRGIGLVAAPQPLLGSLATPLLRLRSARQAA